MDHSWAAPGVWCECVDDEQAITDFDKMLVARYGITLPVKGGKYQIYDVVEHHTEKGRIGVRLVGHVRFVVYDITSFRPLQERDIELFREIASKTPKMEEQDA